MATHKEKIEKTVTNPPTEKLPVVKSIIALREEEILAFWNERQIFEKTLSKESPKGEYVFYDGPPFATGTPHFGHLLAGTMKDAIPRFKTMRGFHVPRKWGWDCHGLPVENIVEKELGLKGKKDIEAIGVKIFNEKARDSIMTFASVWREVIPRMGRFVDMEHDYKTMDSSFTESIWWVFKTLFDKGLIYEGFKAMHLCPHCGTTLSNFEVAQGYKDVADISVTAKFKLKDAGKIGLPEGTCVLAWTTTPWTLPGNVALAVNPEIVYGVVETADGIFVVAEELIPKVFKDKEFKKLSIIVGSKLVGASYEPLFDYYAKDEGLKHRDNGWKIYGADFVTTTDGTGVVHIAPAFGEDDMKLGTKEKLPFVQHVGHDGRFKDAVAEFAGRLVKPKENPQEADIEVLKNLAARGALFSKEKFTHSYPHCWRCDTPLLNYAASSWFVAVSKIKDQLIEVNKKSNWVPAEMRDGRFGKILEGAPDWAISRSRYWGAPMPVWKCHKCHDVKHVAGSLADIRQMTKSENSFLVMRHGEAENNVLHVCSSRAEFPHHLTEKGKGQVGATAEALVGKKIDLIISSPFVRTRETAEIVAEKIGINPKDIIFDDRLREVGTGIFDGKKVDEYHGFWKNLAERFEKAPEGAETYTEIRRRVGDFIYDIDKKYAGKNILIVSHDGPSWLMFALAAGMDTAKTVAVFEKTGAYLSNAEAEPLDFAPLPHNDNYEVDFHRPYIDDVTLACPCGGEVKRIPELFDCWFESGSMPYGQWHYPFENTDKFDPAKGKGFPAEFIGEGLDQTRGWFYSMLVLSVALFGESSYKNVIVNGTIQTEDGQKMSKRLKNYPDPMDVINKFGADALRYFLLSSPAVEAQDMNFSEKGVDEIVKKVLMRLGNVYSFFAMYTEGFTPTNSHPTSVHVLDRWILARLHELTEEITGAMERYELDRAARPIALFVDDLSTWYLRRSRDRFKGDDRKDKNNALNTLYFTLKTFAKLMAPFMPFTAEDLYLNLRVAEDVESVHLESWPVAEATDKNTLLIERMEAVRKIVSLGLEVRAKTGIKVRQPLAELQVKSMIFDPDTSKDLLLLIQDEVNVKRVQKVPTLATEVLLDTVITPELQEEGNVRDFIRGLQEMRKNAKLSVGDTVSLLVGTDSVGRAFVEKYKDEVSRTAGLKDVVFEMNEGETIMAGEMKFAVIIQK